MKRRWFFIAVLAIAASGALAAVAVWPRLGRPRYEGPARHVVVISLDTTRADFLGCYGNEHVRTPSLDAIAAESVQFMDYMTAAPTTLASHTSLFTGKYPHTHGTPRNGFVVNRENVTLAEALKAAGFHTAGFVGSFALDRRFRLSQGFDHYDQEFDLLLGRYGGDQDQRRALDTTGAVIAYLEKGGVPENLFLFVHYFDPHLPYDPPPPYDRMYDPQGPVGVIDIGLVRSQYAASPDAPPPIARRLPLQYAGEVSYMDEHVGRLLDYLRRKRVLDQAVLIVASDHGESLHEHEELFDHGQTTYQATVHGVGMARLPKAAMAGTKITYTVNSVDVLPTLLKFLSLPIPRGVEGEAIDLARPAAAGATRVRFSEATKPHREIETLGEWRNARKARCIRDGKWKLVQSPWRSSEQLFDLIADPAEQTNLLESPTSESDGVMSELRRKLTAWAASAHPLPSEFDSSQRDETRRRLEALGYVN